jgi:hypothetical protein
MIYHKLILSDGTEINKDKIMSTSFTTTTVSGQDVEPGAVCTAELELQLWGEPGSEQLANGSSFRFYNVYEDGTEVLIATLVAEKPTRATAHTYKVIAYDLITKLDVDLSAWVQQQTFPMTLLTFVEKVCAKCGLSLSNSFIANGDYVIQSIGVTGITGRDLLQWAAQIAGQYVQATETGLVDFGWYKDNKNVVLVSEAGEENALVYYQGSLSYEDYTVKAVEKVQLSQGDKDVGVVYPPDLEEGNTYVVSGNCLIASDAGDNLLPLAQYLCLRMGEVAYVPMKVSVPYTDKIHVGDIIYVTDSTGYEFVTYITKCTAEGSKLSLESVGNARRDSVSAINSKKFEQLEGKMFNLDISIDGLKSRAEKIEGAYSDLSQTVDEISTTVSDTKENVTKLEQTAGQVKVSAESEQGTLTTIIANDGTWETKFVDKNGRELSGISFDFLAKNFIFNGSGNFTGSLDIGNGNFIVDVNGNMTAQGDVKIYGGKYYANGDSGYGNYTTMDEDGFSVYSSDNVQRIKIGFPKNHSDSPYVVLNGGTVDTPSQTIFKQFSNGVWIGNDVPIGKYGSFTASAGCNGIFISLTDGKAYVVVGTTMQSLYTGEAIAKFG